jgi:acyl-coenzyme A thioesterase PaaI-like protein
LAADLGGWLYPGMAEPSVHEARVAAAAALRRLSHAMVSRDLDADMLDRLRAEADALAAAIEPAPRRDRQAMLTEHVERMFGMVESEGDLETGHAAFDVMADRAIGGPANPMGVQVDVEFLDDEVVGVVTLLPAYEGGPGRAHGGMVAAIFDDITGYVLRIAQTAAFTGTLSVRYHKPTPMERPLTFRARLVGREDRRLFITADCHDGETLISSCEATYITIDPKTFA